MAPRRTTKQLIEETVAASMVAMRADFEPTRVAVDRLSIAVMGDGQANRGFQGAIQDFRKLLFGNGTEGLCETVRGLAAWKAAWEKVKGIVIGALVVIGLGVIGDILIHLAEAGGIR